MGVGVWPNGNTRIRSGPKVSELALEITGAFTVIVSRS